MIEEQSLSRRILMENFEEMKDHAYWCRIQGKSRICDVFLYPQNNLEAEDLPPDKFDIIICDGPYGILGSKPECEWDDFDLDTKNGRRKFRQYYRNLFNACLKHLEESGSLFIFNYSEGASIIKSLLDDEYAIYFRRWISWVYENHFDFDGGANFQRSHEAILYYTKKAKSFTFHSDHHLDVLRCPIIKIETSLFKDGAKPLEVIRVLLDATYKPGGRLLSLFAGSGTDMVAAIEYDMDAVGFEFNPAHMENIIKRLEAL